MTRSENQKFIKALVDRNIISQTQAENFLKQAQPIVNTEGITQALIKSFNLDENELDEIIADEFDIPFLYSSDGLQWVDVPDLPDEASAKYRFIPIIIEDLELTVAFIDPPYQRLIELLENSTHRQIVPVVITPSAFDMLLMNRSKDVQKQVGSRFDFDIIDVEKRGEKWATSKETIQKLPSANTIFTKLMESALDNQASHIHLDATAKGFLKIRFRIQGVMQRVVTLPIRYTTSLPSLIKQVCRVDSYQGSQPVMGNAVIKIREHKVNAEFHSIPTMRTEKITIALSIPKSEFLNIDEIGLSEHDKIRFQYIINKTGSLVLFCGPPQSGKSTTMYSVIQKFNIDEKNIATLDLDEVRYEMSGLNQVAYSKSEGLTFQDSIKSLSNHNLDILGIDYISDKTKLELAIELTQNDVHVLSTMSAKNSFHAIQNLISLYEDREQIALALGGIISQRLVRKVCPLCTEKYRPKPDMLEFMGLKNLPEDVFFSRGTGCPQCSGIGYLGAIPIFETFYFTDLMKIMFVNKCSLSDIQQEAEKNGFTNMYYDGLRKAVRGLTTIEEVLRQM